MSSLVSLRHFEFLLGMDRTRIVDIATRAPTFYRPFDIAKRGGRDWRHIDNPTGVLKEVQEVLYRKVLRDVPLPSDMVGGVPGRSVKQNALVHLGQRTLIRMDLRNHFGRVSNRRVFEALRNELGCGTDIARLITKLTTLNSRLPQGAATSAMLANLVFCTRCTNDVLA